MHQVHPYLATDCKYMTSNITNKDDNKQLTEGEEVGKHDTEEQNIQIMKLSHVKKATMDGRFVEVQWSKTAPLALLHISEAE